MGGKTNPSMCRQYQPDAEIFTNMMRIKWRFGQPWVLLDLDDISSWKPLKLMKPWQTPLKQSTQQKGGKKEQRERTQVWARRAKPKGTQKGIKGTNASKGKAWQVLVSCVYSLRQHQSSGTPLEPTSLTELKASDSRTDARNPLLDIVGVRAATGNE